MASTYSSIKRSIQANYQETRLRAIPKCAGLKPHQAYSVLTIGMDHWDKRTRTASAKMAAELLGPVAGPHIAQLLSRREIGVRFGINLLAQCECDEAYAVLDRLTRHKHEEIAQLAKRTLLRYKNIPLALFLRHQENAYGILKRIKNWDFDEIVTAVKNLNLPVRYRMCQLGEFRLIPLEGLQKQALDSLVLETVLDYCAETHEFDSFSKHQLDMYKAEVLNDVVLALPNDIQRKLLKRNYSLADYFHKRRMSKVFSITSPTPKPSPGKGKQDLPIEFHGELAAKLGISQKTIIWLARRLEEGYPLYQQSEIIKRSGGTRTISAPHPTLKYVQRMIYLNILAPEELHDAAHGFRPGRSTSTNAANHVGAEIVINLDLKDFFPSITSGRVYGVFARLNTHAEDVCLLTDLCVYQGSLPQGAPTSPALANLVCRRLDARLRGVAESVGAHYSRYADDLSFSGCKNIISALPLIKTIIEQEGFQLAEHKLRITRRGNRQEVTGLTVNDKVTVPRCQRRKIRAMLHAYSQGKKVIWNSHEITEQQMHGHLSYLSSVQPEVAKTLADRYLSK